MNRTKDLSRLNQLIPLQTPILTRLTGLQKTIDKNEHIRCALEALSLNLNSNSKEQVT